jgi:hypothetical protein
MNNQEKKNSQVYAYVIGELAFIFMPFLVMTIIFAYKLKLDEMLKEPEWSLASAVMFGQAIIKMYNGISKNKNNEILHYNVSALFALIMLFGLVPSLIVLSLIYNSTVDLPNWLIIVQIFLFILAVIVFSVVNKIHFEIEEENENLKAK